MIIAHDKWTELLTCSNCGMSGSARLSRPEKRAYDFNVETVPAGFKVVRVEFGEGLLLRSLQSTGGHPMASGGLFCLNYSRRRSAYPV